MPSLYLLYRLLAQRDRDLNAERDAILNGTSSPYLDALTTITTAHEHALSTASRRRDIAHASIKAELSARHQQLQQEFIGRRAALRRLLLSGLARVKAEVGDARRMEETWRVERLLTVRPGLDVPELPPPPAPMKQRRRNWMAMAPTFDPWSAPEAQRQSSQSPPAALPSPTPIFRSDMQHRENLHVTHEYASTMDENATHVPPRLVAHGLHDAEIEEDLAMLRGMASMCEMEVVAKEENQEETLPPATRCGTVADVAAVAVAALEVDDNTTPTTTSSA